MTEEKTCYNCGNKNCHIFYSAVKQNVEEHHETYEYTDFDCVDHDKWKEMKVEEIRTDSTEPLKNAKKITEDEILKIKEHIEIHSRREPRAIKITAILRKAVDELERIKELEKENAELKEKISYLKDNLRVARKDRENLQLDVAKGLKEFVKDFPATSLRYLANEKYVERLTEVKDIIKDYMIVVKGGNITVCSVPEENRCINVLKLNEQAEQFLKE